MTLWYIFSSLTLSFLYVTKYDDFFVLTMYVKLLSYNSKIKTNER
jgi:hypothetical protein